jgi:hypothetical protein
LLLVYKSGPVTLFSFAEKTMALMTPKMATSSQNMILRSKTKRLLQREVRDQILCAYTGGFDSASEDGSSGNENTPGGELDFGMRYAYHAAPMTERPISNPTPSNPHEYGLVSIRNLPGENCSPAPVKSISNISIPPRTSRVKVHSPTTVKKETPAPPA